MKILRVEIHNYRNLNGLTVDLDGECNFIVGENNLGKSNLLALLNLLFTAKGFHGEDFTNHLLPIEVHFRLELAEEEIGHFQDLFDTADYSLINVVARQPNATESISFFHHESDTFIPMSVVRAINFIHYDSLRNPISEINFDKGRGVGRFLRNIIAKHLFDSELRDSQFLDEEKITELLSSINDKVRKIKSFKDFGISASQDKDVENLLSKIVVLTDSSGKNLTKAGYGVQFLILITLSILERLQSIQQYRGDTGVFEKEDGSRSISLVLGLDEPEIHLHPYQQRSLIKYLNSIVSGGNEDFKSLIKELFNIDKFIGQVIVATHSPNVLLSDYKQIARLYSEGGITKIVSGKNVVLSEQLRKHLYMQFVFIKEAFFSRCAIFVEGECEQSCFPLFGKKMGIDFDDLGICVIQARGSAVQQLIDIAGQFKIPCVGISDKDDGGMTPSSSNHLLTNARNFEAEIIQLIDAGKENVLRSILTKYDAAGVNRTIQSGALTKYAHKTHAMSATPYTADLQLATISATDTSSLKAFYVSWCSINKSYPLGFLIGSDLEISEIPTVYQQVILEAKRLSENV